MKRANNLAARIGVLAAVCIFCLALVPKMSRGATITLGQIDNFQDGTTDNWTNGPNPDPLNIATLGPAGSGDRFLEIQSNPFGGGPRLVSFNRSQWTGNFITAGVNKIAVDLKDLSTPPLSIRIALRQGTSGSFTPGYASTSPFALPADGNWHHATFFIDAAHLTAVNGPAALPTFLTSVAEFRLLSAASPSLLGDSTSGQFGVDNLQALHSVPEPSTVISAILGVACLCTFVRLARARSSTS